MRFPFTYLGKPPLLLVEQKRAAWQRHEAEPMKRLRAAWKTDDFERWLIAGLMICTLAFLVLFLLMLGQLP